MGTRSWDRLDPAVHQLTVTSSASRQSANGCFCSHHRNGNSIFTAVVFNRRGVMGKSIWRVSTGVGGSQWKGHLRGISILASGLEPERSCREEGALTTGHRGRVHWLLSSFYLSWSSLSASCRIPIPPDRIQGSCHLDTLFPHRRRQFLTQDLFPAMAPLSSSWIIRQWFTGVGSHLPLWAGWAVAAAHIVLHLPSNFIGPNYCTILAIITFYYQFKMGSWVQPLWPSSRRQPLPHLFTLSWSSDLKVLLGCASLCN